MCVSARKRVAVYVAKKVASYAVVLFISFTVVFFFLRLIPGDPVSRFVNLMMRRYGYEMAPELYRRAVEEYKKAFGLDKDLLTQYLYFLRELARLNLGPSFLNFPTPSQVLILRALPWSIGLLGIATVIAWIIGVVVGTLLAWFRGSKLDHFLFTVAICMSQVPYYLMALFLVLLFAYIIPLFPSRGAYSPALVPELNIGFLWSVLRHGTLPALSLILISAFGWIVSTRSIAITIIGEDYLRLAIAKGLKKRRILSRYVLRNALLPQVTGLAMSLGFVVNGFYLVEWIFSYPGVGTLLSLALGVLDYNTIQGIILLSMFAVLTANLLIDLLYP